MQMVSIVNALVALDDANDVEKTRKQKLGDKKERATRRRAIKKRHIGGASAIRRTKDLNVMVEVQVCRSLER